MAEKIMTAVADAQLDTAYKKFGTASGLFDGIADCVTTPDSPDWDLGVGKFTIDFWFMRPSSAPHTVVGQNDGSKYWVVYIYNTYVGFVVNHGSGEVLKFDKNYAFSVDTWYHIAIVRDGTTEGTWYLFVDGVEQTKKTWVNGYGITIENIGAVLNIGFPAGIADAFNGHLEELRVSKGVARWTSNFTPPTVAYTTDADTQLLLHFDGTDASTDFVDSSAEVIKKANFFFAT